MNTEIKEADKLLKLVDVYFEKIYLNRIKLENFKIDEMNKVCDLCKYIIFYYLKKIIQKQIGKKKMNYSFNEFADEIVKINNELELYLTKKYPETKLLENIKSIPINSRRVGILIPKKKSKSIFSKFGDKEEAIYLNQVQKLLFGDEKYFKRYIELNENKSIEKFDLIKKLQLYTIVDSLEDILKTLKSQTIRELNQNSDMENTEMNKVKDISFIVEEYVKHCFEIELRNWILNEKLRLIDSEINKLDNLNIEELNILIGKKEKYLYIIENTMSDLVFKKFEFKGDIDKLIEKNIYKIYDKIPWDLDLQQSIEYIDQKLFLDLVYKTLEIVYREIKY